MNRLINAMLDLIVNRLEKKQNLSGLDRMVQQSRNEIDRMNASTNAWRKHFSSQKKQGV